MIDRARFEMIKEKHGAYASWAVWAIAGERPKSNIGDLGVLDPDRNDALLTTLQPGVVMVGLNISRWSSSEPFRNFHDPSPRANDFKIRYAFTGTPFEGAYMTDVIKNLELVDSSEVVARLKFDPNVVRENMETFRAELRDLGANRPTILVFGAEAHGSLRGVSRPANTRAWSS